MVQGDYEALLKRGEKILSKSNKNMERLKIPDPDIIYEGKLTIVRNFGDMLSLINRDPRHITKFLMSELGIGLTLNGKRLIINRKVTLEQFMSKMNMYMDTFVMCYECNSPDTELQKVGRTTVLVCKACGAQHPIRMGRESKENDTDIEEGKQYTIQVTSIGPSGEGRGIFRGYNIFVPGVKKGETVKVLIKKIRNNTAIAEVVDREK